MSSLLKLSVPLIALLAWCNAAIAAPEEGVQEAARQPVVFQIRLENQAITPITTRFIQKAIRQAEKERAECLLIVLDTPGGLVDSTRTIVRSMLASEVPVVVYVAPSGARAASAGVFVTLAAHVAAMAPGTNIGAAHPVQVGRLPTLPRQPDSPAEDDEAARTGTTMEVKIVSDTAAWARSLAALRERNADWAERAVRESISAGASEAVEEGAVDLLARDVDDLLAQIDAREIVLPARTVRLNTEGARIQTLDMWWGEQILALITNPNIAFLLLIFGFYGILFELYAPGWGVAGTLGVVCLLLGMLSMAILPINAVGLLLIAVAMGLFLAEVFVVSYGALTVGGVICLTLGAVMLIDSPVGFQRVSLWTVLPVALATGVIMAFLVAGVVKAHRERQFTGTEALVGSEAVAHEDFVAEADRFRGRVQLAGEMWNAVSTSPVRQGDGLTVRSRDGLTLEVQPCE